MCQNIEKSNSMYVKKSHDFKINIVVKSNLVRVIKVKNVKKTQHVIVRTKIDEKKIQNYWRQYIWFDVPIDSVLFHVVNQKHCSNKRDNHHRHRTCIYRIMQPGWMQKRSSALKLPMISSQQEVGRRTWRVIRSFQKWVHLNKSTFIY